MKNAFRKFAAVIALARRSGLLEVSTQELVLRATGGLMTMLTAPGAGTNTATGSAHQDAFDDLAAAEAEEIAAVLNEKLFAPVLDQWHPGQPHLVEFIMKRPDSDNAAGAVQNIVALAGAGYKTEAEQASGLTGLQLEYHEPSAPAAAPQQAALNSLRVRYAPTMLYPPARAAFEAALNSKAKKPGFVGTESRSVYAEATPLRNSGESEPPLNAGELAALRALGGELNPAQIAADADYMTREMLAGLREPVSNTRSLLDALLVTNAAPERCGADNPAECSVHGVPPHEWNPHIMPDKMAPDKARAELLEGAQVKNPLREDVTLDRRILRHWEKENKKADDIEKRLAALPLIKQVVAKPAEIWEAPDGSRTYLASVYNPYENAKMKDGKKTGGKKYTIVFTQAKDNTTIETYWPEAETVNKKRAGKLLFSEKRPVASDT